MHMDIIPMHIPNIIMEMLLRFIPLSSFTGIFPHGMVA